MLFYSTAPTAQDMANASLSWRAALGFNDHFLVITDNGSHFSNNLLETLSKKIGFEQTFSIAYYPWTNGPVGTINTTILRFIRSLVSQYHLHESEWLKLPPTITYIINNRPSSRRLGRTPNELFLYFKLKIPLLRKSTKHFAISIKNHAVEPLDVPDLVSSADEFMKELEKLQDETFNHVKLKQDLENGRLNKKRNVVFQYSKGDYVLVSEHGTLQANEKTRLTWLGPYQVIDVVSKDVYIVESLLGKTRTIHASRLWFYGDKNLLET
eukprot:snap_masked-scaffold_11-processed-gene-5.27-mRNA-1 protein AED:0.58 eAED:0.58 QI:0/-1/0/1/-1/1/1/0/267